MSRKTKIKVFKIILAILVLTLFIGITTYLFPVMKDLSSIEGQIAFKEKVDNSGMFGLIIIIWTSSSTNISNNSTRRTNRNTCRNVLWWIFGNNIYYGISFYNINNNILFSKKVWKKICI